MLAWTLKKASRKFYNCIWFSKLHNFRKNQELWEVLESMTEIFRNSCDFIWYSVYITSAFHENKNEAPEIYRVLYYTYRKDKFYQQIKKENYNKILREICETYDGVEQLINNKILSFCSHVKLSQEDSFFSVYVFLSVFLSIKMVAWYEI